MVWHVRGNELVLLSYGITMISSPTFTSTGLLKNDPGMTSAMPTFPSRRPSLTRPIIPPVPLRIPSICPEVRFCGRMSSSARMRCFLSNSFTFAMTRA